MTADLVLQRKRPSQPAAFDLQAHRGGPVGNPEPVRKPHRRRLPTR